jgi:putative ATP-binding cassette transporter
MENKSIFVFDEIAADQDPEFRKFFYKTLIPQMKKEGKIIIAITHDDHYFDIADKIVKFDEGRIEFIKSNTQFSTS